ncbi:beta-ketoacyl-[acyl-carrier-protein] synthase family protein [Candidatus Pacearchaeota archaeon]|nr:beta-ketoacyl-[acyl-carrier-protein] synthase family protein [Candidatus Pacearchaeota archaeon]
MSKRVVITGLGPVCPNGVGIDKKEFWYNISNGNQISDFLPRVEQRGYGLVQACIFKDFNLDTYFAEDRKNGNLNRKAYAKLRYDDKSIQFGVLAAKLALEDSGIEYDPEDNHIGVYFGNAEEAIYSTEQASIAVFQRVFKKTFKHFKKHINPFNFFKIKKELEGYLPLLEEERLEDFVDLLSKTCGNLHSFTPPSSVNYKSYAIPGKIASFFNLHGPGRAINTGCASGLDAIGLAAFAIKHGYIEAAVAGGSEAPISLQAISSLGNLGVLSKTLPKPFCIDRDGFAIAEGAGGVVLEERESAIKRGAKIYAEIKGYGSTNDANLQTCMIDPYGTYLAKAMKIALNSSELNTDEIDYINVHGTATPQCEPAETAAVKYVFNADSKKLNLSGTKSMTGHSIGAVGGIETIISACAIQENIVPPTINLLKPDPVCDLNNTPNVAQEREINNAMILSMGFGGYNSAMILGK